MKMFSLLLLLAAASCTKEQPLNPQIATEPQAVKERTTDTYNMNMSNHTASFYYRYNVLENGTVVYSSDWELADNLNTGYNEAYIGDSANEYKFVAYFKAGPNGPTNLSLDWFSNCNGASSSGNFYVGNKMVTKTRTFFACE
jgi:hypothetical protein